MNGAHLHLILTHVPVLGVAFATGLLALGMVRNNRAMQQTALGVLILAGLAAGAAYWTGEGAEEVIEDQLAGGKPYVERHEAAALYGLILAGLSAVAAVLALVSGRKGRALPKGLTGFTLILGLLTSGTMAWVANLGGQIGHPEIRSGQVLTGGERESGEGHP